MTSPSVQYVLTLTCPDRPGIVHDVSGFVVNSGGNIIDSAQFGDSVTNLFCMRIDFSVSAEGSESDELRDLFQEIATRYEMDWSIHEAGRKARVLIMVSKFDHCLIDLLYRQRIGELNIEVPAVISNHRDTYKLVASHNIPFHHLPVTKDTKRQQEEQVLAICESENIDFVVMARYMQILSTEFCDALPGRIINIHHSFLPGFKGARPYHQAHERGVKLIGATAHYATADLDEGPIIEQGVARVTHSQSPENLAAVGRDIETQVLAKAVKYQAEHRVMLNGHKTIVFG
jgi:formyltetrahydrofolate deformylase